MINKIAKRVKSWKRIYTQDLMEVDENSSWREILKVLNPTTAQSMQLCMQASVEAGCFDEEEIATLYSLPHYAVIAGLNNIPNHVMPKFSCSIHGEDILCTTVEHQPDGGSLVFITVVTKFPVELDTYTLMGIGDTYKQVVVEYRHKLPQDVLDMWHNLEEQSHNGAFMPNEGHPFSYTDMETPF